MAAVETTVAIGRAISAALTRATLAASVRVECAGVVALRTAVGVSAAVMAVVGAAGRVQERRPAQRLDNAKALLPVVAMGRAEVARTARTAQPTAVTAAGTYRAKATMERTVAPVRLTAGVPLARNATSLETVYVHQTVWAATAAMTDAEDRVAPATVDTHALEASVSKTPV